MKSLKVCIYPWCNATTYGRYCERHKDDGDKKDKRDAKASRVTPINPIYQTKQWRILSKYIIARDPICKICNRAASREADHKTPMARGGDPWDENNLQGVCKPCHSRKTATEDGRWARKTY